jgi:hypothetical protein
MSLMMTDPENKVARAKSMIMVEKEKVEPRIPRRLRAVVAVREKKVVRMVIVGGEIQRGTEVMGMIGSRGETAKGIGAKGVFK